jgi:hypothetical protein
MKNIYIKIGAKIAIYIRDEAWDKIRENINPIARQKINGNIWTVINDNLGGSIRNPIRNNIENNIQDNLQIKFPLF